MAKGSFTRVVSGSLKKYWSIVILIAVTISHSTPTFGFPPLFTSDKDRQAFLGPLNEALKPVVSQKVREAITRTFFRQQQDETIRQILGDARISTLRDFASRMLVILDATFNGRQWGGYLPTLLEPRETAAIIWFYKSIDPKGDSLISGRMNLSDDSALANDLRKITRWPSTPLHPHGVDHPPAPFDLDAWLLAQQAFLSRDLHVEWLLLFSQLVNYEKSHERTAQIAGFDRMFYELVREIAPKFPRQALKAFMASLASTKTDPLVAASGGQDLPSEDARTLASLLIRMPKWTRAQLERLFAQGKIPRNLKVPRSASLETAREVFRRPANAPLSALVEACISEKARN